MKQLRYLCAVAKYKHFGKAAKSCFVSQSALSTGIHELEQNLNVKLFERGSKQVILTDVGHDLLGRAQSILNDINDLISAADTNQAFKRQVKLGVIPTIAPFVLPKLLKTMSKSYPDTRVLIREDISSGLLKKLYTGELDLLLMALPYATEGIHIHPLFDDELLLIMAKKHVLNSAEEIALNDLKNHDILLLEDNHCLRNQALDACGLSVNEISIPYQATSLSTLIPMVENNIGISLLPSMAINNRMLKGTKIVPRQLKKKNPIKRTIALLWRKRSPHHDAFIHIGEMIKAIHQTP